MTRRACGTDGDMVTRRRMMGLTGAGVLALGQAAGVPWGRSALAAETGPLPDLPAADPDPDDPFQVDRTINMGTIDAWLGRPDVAYRDMRLFRDPAYYEEIGGSAALDFTLRGFKVAPYPYIGTLQKLPVAGAYEGPRLFDVDWADDGSILNARPNFEQSELIVGELFPRDRVIFLMCGGAGYANMMRRLLLHLGWDPALVFNVGGAWSYAGYELVELAHTRPDGTVSLYSWRADTVRIDFDEYTPTALKRDA